MTIDPEIRADLVREITHKLAMFHAAEVVNMARTQGESSPEQMHSRLRRECRLEAEKIVKMVLGIAEAVNFQQTPPKGKKDDETEH